MIYKRLLKSWKNRREYNIENELWRWNIFKVILVKDIIPDFWIVSRNWKDVFKYRKWDKDIIDFRSIWKNTPVKTIYDYKKYKCFDNKEDALKFLRMLEDTTGAVYDILPM